MSRVYSDEILALEKAGGIPKEDSFYHRIHRTYKNVGLDLDRVIIDQFEEDNIFISEVTGYHKPSLGAFRYVEEHLGVKPEEIWYIGDTYEADVLGGKRVSWDVIWYNHRYREFPEEGNVANITVNTAEELLEVIKNECL